MTSHRIVSSQNLNQEFKDLCAMAKSQRRGWHVLEMAERAMARLQNDPESFGETQYHLKNTGFPAKHAVFGPWSIHFAIDSQRKLVFVKSIALLD
jgi:hypothetical protein